MRLVRLLVVTGLATLGLISVAAQAQTAVPTATGLVAPATRAFGDPLVVQVTVSYSVPPCPSGPLTRSAGTVTIKRNGTPIAQGDALFASPPACVNGQFTAGATFDLGHSQFGNFKLTAEFSGGNGLAPSVSAPFAVSIQPSASLTSAAGALKIGVSSVNDNRLGEYWGCSPDVTQLVEGVNVPPPPPNLHFPYGMVRFAFSGCAVNPGCGEQCPPTDIHYPAERMMLEAPSALPSNASVWTYAASGGMTTPVWRKLPASVHDAGASFFLEGNDGDTGMTGYVGIALDNSNPVQYQDMWWAGPAENGWGAHIAQNGDRLFTGLYAYRDDGTPMWVVMSGGTWDGAHKVFSGSLYSPRGTWYAGYNPSNIVVGNPVGTAKLTFSSDSAAALDFTLNGTSGHKSIERLPFAPASPRVQGPYAGLWWGGTARTGFGVAIGHQNNTLFAVWYTYDKNGLPTWFVMPGQSFFAPGTDTDGGGGTGTLYRTSGSPWLGATYDPSRFVATPVGKMTLSFSPAGDVGVMRWSVDGDSGVETIYKQPF